MALSIPNYLKSVHVQDSSLHYEWEDRRTLVLESPNEELVVRLKGLSYRAALAFACGSAEWIVYRFAKLCDDPAPWNYIEAAWALIIDDHYVGYSNSNGWDMETEIGWRGPVKGPIRKSLKDLEIAFEQLASEYFADPAAFAARFTVLVRYFMPDPAPYDQWCEQVLRRFEALYPQNPKDPLGDVVPRQAVDIGFDFEVEQTEGLIILFLASLDPWLNSFLSFSGSMLEHFDGTEDFHGTPYMFDIKADRKLRRKEL